MDAQQLLFGPRPIKRGDGSVPEHYFSDSRKGSTKAALAYLLSRANELRVNSQLDSLARLVAETEIKDKLSEEGFFELRPDQNSHAIDSEIIADEEKAEHELDALGRGFINALRFGQDNTFDILTNQLWQNDEIGPLALKMVNSFAGEEWQEEQIDHMLAILIIAWREEGQGPLFNALRSQLGWMLLRRSEALGLFILRDISLIDDRSEIFVHDSIDIARGDNTLHIRGERGFYCGREAGKQTAALRGVWRECPRFLGENPLYQRCPDCEKDVDQFLSPGCEDLEPSLLGWTGYSNALKYIDMQLEDVFERPFEEELDDYEYFIAATHIHIERIVSKTRLFIAEEHGRSTTRYIAEALRREHRPDDLSLLENFWGSDIVGERCEEIIQIEPPSAETIYQWTAAIFDDVSAIDDESELGDSVFRFCHTLNDKLQEHFSIEAGPFSLAELR